MCEKNVKVLGQITSDEQKELELISCKIQTANQLLQPQFLSEYNFDTEQLATYVRSAAEQFVEAKFLDALMYKKICKNHNIDYFDTIQNVDIVVFESNCE